MGCKIFKHWYTPVVKLVRPILCYLSIRRYRSGMTRLSIAKPIDELLGGGLENGCITNFYGPSASGKTNVVISAVVACVDSGKRVVFVDTEGSFSLERLEQIGIKEVEHYTDRIVFLNPKDWREQKKSIREVEDACKNEGIGLVVVDSISALWRLTIDDENYQIVNRELATQLSILSKIARDKNIPVLITNQVYDDIVSGRLEISAKNIVKWWSKNLIELMKAGQTSHRYAIIRKARSVEEDKQVEFKLTGKGIEKTSGIRLF
jgi:DNA repair protein RadB